MTDGAADRAEATTRAGAMARASLRTRVEAPELVAAALEPDNTDEMHTRVVGGAVETTIERPSAGGLRTTADDYVCNLSVATRVIAAAGDPGSDANEGDTSDDHDANERESIDQRESTDEHFHTDDADTP